MIAASTLLATCQSGAVIAQERGHGFGSPAHTHMDARDDHAHSYYDHGYALRGAPQGGYAIHHAGGAYLYDRSHWYRRSGGNSVVIAAPVGAFVPFLPWYYSTIWWNDLPFYYANDTYYAWNAGEAQYQVIEPPAGIESAPTSTGPGSGDLFIYPKNGQSAEQQRFDKSDCQRTAVEQTGFDPAITTNGLSADAASTKGADYRRAEVACLDSSGYSVK